ASIEAGADELEAALGSVRDLVKRLLRLLPALTFPGHGALVGLAFGLLALLALALLQLRQLVLQGRDLCGLSPGT
ncbi:MAG: hypothetical protein AAFV53_29680, partial [Myxococcota bacterium]